MASLKNAYRKSKDRLGCSIMNSISYNKNGQKAANFNLLQPYLITILIFLHLSFLILLIITATILPRYTFNSLNNGLLCMLYSSLHLNF